MNRLEDTVASPVSRPAISAFLRRLAWSCRAPLYYRIKRAIDATVSALLIVVLAPLALFVAISIRIESRGPILFAQTRVGLRGRTFTCWKFRSMYADAEARRSALEDSGRMSGGVRFKMKRDPRITRVGRVLRKLSIDELPQLWNVLVGDMSLVGPRPPIPQEVAQYSLSDRLRLAVTPGITCIWQVSGRSSIPFETQVLMDRDYAERQSLQLDLSLLARTVPAVLLGRGAY
jgi:lipopolysaccharide/colanic/teichoic acid biosynthesis glycosyltransferase